MTPKFARQGRCLRLENLRGTGLSASALFQEECELHEGCNTTRGRFTEHRLLMMLRKLMSAYVENDREIRASKRGKKQYRLAHYTRCMDGRVIYNVRKRKQTVLCEAFRFEHRR